jgi:Protein of unknown function (DUF2628)
MVFQKSVLTREAMPVYTVHAPTANSADLRVTDGFIFIRDGFHLWAAILGVIWLAWHRLWIAMLGWIVLMSAIDIAMVQLRFDASTIFLVDVLLALLLGFEASSLRRWTFSRRNWRQLDIVVADDVEAAERRFFERWSTRQRSSSNSQPPVDRGAPPPVRDSRGQPFANPPPLPAGGIIGLFPEPGGQR